jgi:hypothetical protein
MDSARPMRSVVFDDQGEVWDARSSHQLARDLHASIGGEEFVDYVIRNLGFVAAKEIGGSVRISLRPAVVSPIAFSALLYWLHDRPADRVLISFCETDWAHEMVPSRQEAVRRLLKRVDFNRTREGDFLSQALSVKSLPWNSPFCDVLRAWEACGGKYDREHLSPILERALNGRFVLVEAHPDRPAMLIKDVGSGLTKPAEYWLGRSIGNRVEDQPDYDFGKWVAAYYRDVIKTGQPALDTVDAVINWPQQARRSFCYHRLVVPFTREDQSTVLMTASLVERAASLRAKPA